MRTVCRLLALAGGSVLCLALPATAGAQDTPIVQAGGGYLHLARPDITIVNGVSEQSSVGWFGKAFINATSHVAAVGEVFGSHHDATNDRGMAGSARVHGLFGGVRARPVRCPLIRPFGHALAGSVFSRYQPNEKEIGPGWAVAERPFAFAVGGGADIRQLHVAVDLMRVRDVDFFSDWSFRIGAGVMLPGR